MDVLCQVETGFTVTLASGLPHHRRTCSAVIGPRVSWISASPPSAADCGFLEVDVQHHLTPATARSSVLLGQIERLLVAGDVADRAGAAYVEGVGGTQQELLVGVRGDRCLQVQGVGEVDVAIDPDPASDVNVGQGNVEVPGLGGREALGLGGLGIEAGFGLLDQPVELGGADLVRERRDLGVHERRSPPGTNGSVRSAINASRHAGSSPFSTRAQHPGSR